VKNNFCNQKVTCRLKMSSRISENHFSPINLKKSKMSIQLFSTPMIVLFTWRFWIG